MKSILVIGAGITGVSSAEWLRRDGWQVTLIDRIDPGHPDQTSFGNAGLIARGAIIPVSVPGLWDWVGHTRFQIPALESVAEPPRSVPGGVEVVC